MGRLLLALVLVSACAGPAATREASPLASASPQPPPAVAEFADRIRKSSSVARLDRIAIRELTAAEIASSQLDSRSSGPVWAVAIVGEIRPNFGVMARPNSPCGVWFMGEDGLSLGAAESSLRYCAPYFADSLVPPSAPVRCGPEPQGYAVFDGYRFSPTTPGPASLATSRDDRWTAPTAVPGTFLYEAPEGSGSYYETFCRSARVAAVPGTADATMLAGLGAPKVSPAPAFAQIWLKDVHAVSASATADGVVSVLAERRAGFEIASFDWHALAPKGGYVKFEFLDRSGNELIKYTVGNGP